MSNLKLSYCNLSFTSRFLPDLNIIENGADMFFLSNMHRMHIIYYRENVGGSYITVNSGAIHMQKNKQIVQKIREFLC
jgi:hypothetical protein